MSQPEDEDPDQVELDDPDARNAMMRLMDVIDEIGKAVDDSE